MRPYMLKSHSRPLTRVRYNREGDLLVSCAKDNQPTLWRVENGERLGTYEGHGGTVWDANFNFDTTRLITGSADQTAQLFDVKTGQGLYKWQFTSGIKSAQWSYGDKMALLSQDSTFSQIPHCHIIDIAASKSDQSPTPRVSIEMPDTQNVALWGPLNETIITGGKDCELRIWDVETQQITHSDRKWQGEKHQMVITDIQYNKDDTMIITSSKDGTARAWDARNLQLIKTYKSDRPLNSACFSPTYNQIILGGGQDARDVTTTSARSGHFECDFYQAVYENYMGSVKGHFGPINCLAFSPTGQSYASGSEDGYIRLHHFPEKYHLQSKTYNW